MGHIIVMPKLGVTMERGTIVSWLKKEGDFIEEGESFVEVETDKTSQEVESEFEGILRKILMDEDEEAAVGTPIAVIAGEDEDIETLLEEAARYEKAEEAEIITMVEEEKEAVSETAEKGGRINATPRAKKLAKERGVELASVPFSGSRITEEDVESYLSGNSDSVGEVPEGELIPYTGIRKFIGEKLLHSYNSKPHIYDMITVNMSAVMARRQADKSARANAYSSADYLMMACADALAKNKIVNSTIQGEKITQHDQINIGYAVATDRGLIVPVIKGLEKMDIQKAAGVKAELVKRALDNHLTAADLEGGTFTISNLGTMGVKTLTAIINEPEAAILAVGALEKRVIVGEGDIPAVAWCMDITLCSDHRVIDGYNAAKTLAAIREYLENIK